MKCPYCHHEEIKVIETRETSDDVTRRRRECLDCKKRFTTYERIEIVELIVIKKDGNREQFSRPKLKMGITRACEKRPVTHDQIEGIVDKVESELRQKESIEIPSKEVGELVMKELKRIDKVSYIRFASVYRDFADLSTFQKELKKLIR